MTNPTPPQPAIEINPMMVMVQTAEELEVELAQMKSGCDWILDEQLATLER
jgi:hypothetical protein